MKGRPENPAPWASSARACVCSNRLFRSRNALGNTEARGNADLPIPFPAMHMQWLRRGSAAWKMWERNTKAGGRVGRVPVVGRAAAGDRSRQSGRGCRNRRHKPVLSCLDLDTDVDTLGRCARAVSIIVYSCSTLRILREFVFTRCECLSLIIELPWAPRPVPRARQCCLPQNCNVN